MSVDEFVVPFVIEELANQLRLLKTGDAVVFFNFRPDRAIQLSHGVNILHRLMSSTLSEKHPTNLKFISFTHYSDEVVVRCCV